MQMQTKELLQLAAYEEEQAKVWIKMFWIAEAIATLIAVILFICSSNPWSFLAMAFPLTAWLRVIQRRQSARDIRRQAEATSTTRSEYAANDGGPLDVGEDGGDN